MQNIVLIVVAFVVFIFILGSCKGKSSDKGDGEYMLHCQKMIKGNAKYPATIDFDNFKARVVKRDGEVTVVLPFTTKNAFGVPVSSTANCTMSSDGTNQQILIH